jgi:hypothetical protein
MAFIVAWDAAVPRKKIRNFAIFDACGFNLLRMLHNFPANFAHAAHASEKQLLDRLDAFSPNFFEYLFELSLFLSFLQLLLILRVLACCTLR